MPPRTPHPDTYLAQRVFSASPEQQAALLMEAGQRHLGKAMQALQRRDRGGATHSFIRVAEVLAEATLRLDLAQGGEVAHNLSRLYGWWGHEVMVASAAQDVARLEGVAQGMSGLREAWEHLHRRRQGHSDEGSQARVV
jgi:flagellar protein FliS